MEIYMDRPIGLSLFFQRRQACRSAYRYQLRRNEKDYVNFYSNALHESLLSKDILTRFGVVGNPNLFIKVND